MNVYLRNLLALYVFIHFFIYSYCYLMICLVLTRLFVCLYLSIYLFSYLFISQFTCMTIPNIRIYEYTIISTCLVKKFYFFDTIQCLRLHDRPRINTMHPISQRDFLPIDNLPFQSHLAFEDLLIHCVLTRATLQQRLSWRRKGKIYFIMTRQVFRLHQP